MKRSSNWESQTNRVTDAVGRIVADFVDIGTEVVSGAARAFADAVGRSSRPRSPINAMRETSGACLRMVGKSANDIAQTVSRACAAAAKAIEGDDRKML